jgi:hypothetical protein
MMVTRETRSHSGARIDDRRGGHTLISPVRVQETECGTPRGYTYRIKVSRSSTSYWSSRGECDAGPCCAAGFGLRAGASV